MIFNISVRRRFVWGDEMNKRNSFVMILLAVCLFVTSCDSVGSKYADNAKVISHQSDAGNWTSTMSDEETERLRYLLKEQSGWIEDYPCTSVLERDHLMEVELDGMYYCLCTDYWYTYSRDIHSISYKNSADEEYKHAILNEDEDIMIEIYDMVRNRRDLGTEYTIFMYEHQKKSSHATLDTREPGNDEKITVSKEDTERLRMLLSLESGWEQKPANLLPVECLLVLDNVQYEITTSRVEHEVRYSVVTDEISSVRDHGLVNDDIEVVHELYDIVGKYIE